MTKNKPPTTSIYSSSLLLQTTFSRSAWRGLLGLKLAFTSRLYALQSRLSSFWSFEIVAATFIRRSPNSMAARLNIKLFSIAALLYIIAAVLVMFLVGGIISLAATILRATAFFRIPVEKPSQPSAPA